MHGKEGRKWKVTKTIYASSVETDKYWKFSGVRGTLNWDFYELEPSRTPK